MGGNFSAELTCRAACVDSRIKDLDHLIDFCGSFHLVQAHTEPIPKCEGNPSELECIGCKGFKHSGICSHVLCINHILKRYNVRYQLATIGKRARKHTGGQYRAPPALQRDVQREPDSSDEEEERLLALGADGK